MEQREDRSNDRAGTEPLVSDAVQHCVVKRALRQHRPLGRARRARRVHQQQRALRRALLLSAGSGGLDPVGASLGGERIEILWLGTGIAQHVGKGRFGERRRWLAVFELEAGLRCGQAVVDGDQDRAEMGAGEEQFQHLDAIEGANRHAVASAHAAAAKLPRHAVDSSRELCVGNFLAIADDGGAKRCPAGPVIDPAEDAGTHRQASPRVNAAGAVNLNRLLTSAGKRGTSPLANPSGNGPPTRLRR